ncbi:unnamed protein product, partial [Chrysoparadoxa australica]
GAFRGEVETRWLKHEGKDREMQLLKDFGFKDKKQGNMMWVAPRGSIIDGASIPPFLWSFVGTPFVGDYRRATVLHDIACKEQSMSHKLVHRMFFNAMRCDGVGHLRAWVMYKAVQVGGPKWGTDAPRPHD